MRIPEMTMTKEQEDAISLLAYSLAEMIRVYGSAHGHGPISVIERAKAALGGYIALCAGIVDDPQEEE